MDIVAITAGSLAEHAGLRIGDRLLTINGRPVRDCVDFLYLSADDALVLEAQSPDGRRRTLRIAKAEDDDLGLTPAPDPIRRCSNRCVFCFVDQLPRGLRPSLYVKDEDYRLSFLHGSYVTLTDLGPADLDRIGEQRLSPLYVSVHATEPDLRARLLGNPRVGDIMDTLRRLAEDRITVHAQVVLCPGVNDGAHLERTVEDLLSLYPQVESVAVVPVGLTAHRGGLAHLTPCTPRCAAALIDEVGAWQRSYLDRLRTRGVFLADEFYLMSGIPLPPVSEFESLAQVENGVGMTSRFLEDARILSSFPASEVRRVRAALVTGVLMEPVLETRIGRPIRAAGGRCTVIGVRNGLLGDSITVSGLLAGSDIEAALDGVDRSLRVFLPPNSVSADGRFLDDVRPQDLGDRLGREISVAPAQTAAWVADLIGGGR